ncbi:glycerophosphoinositol inositolphosphodiesterase GDPD2-like isoform X2 [Apostichopus japonicus]
MVKMGCKRCCTVFATIFYGCRCKHHDKRPTALCERSWFIFLFLSVLLTFSNMYLWLVTANEERMFDLGFWSKFNLDFKFYFAFKIASFVLFGYPFILLMFACLHMNLKEHLHLHAFHKILLVVVDIITIAIVVLSILNTRFLWHFIPLSLMFFGPFLHLFAVMTMTIITWFIAGAFGTLERKGEPKMKKDIHFQTATLLPPETNVSPTNSDQNRHILRRRQQVDPDSPNELSENFLQIAPAGTESINNREKRNPVRDLCVWYFLLLVALYLVPLFIKSPCILEGKDLTSKPRLIGHKGAEHIAPENTMASFERAVDDCEVYGIESDIRISSDGEHFCMHDDTLERTTNVQEIFPERTSTLVEWFTFTDLKSLNTGSWFLERDPFGTVAELTDEQRTLYQEQTVPKLTELLDLASEHQINVLFDLRPPPEGHPYQVNFVEYTKEKLIEYGLEETEMDFMKAPNGPHYVVFIKKFDDRKLENVYNDVTFQSIREKNNEGISTNVWTINKRWVYSLFWCGQTFSVTTSFCRDLRDMEEPSWQLTHTHYLIMWVMYDVVSFMWAVIFLVCQLRRKRKRNITAEDEERQQETAF